MISLRQIFSMQTWFGNIPYTNYMLITFFIIAMVLLVAGFYFTWLQKKNRDNKPGYYIKHYTKYAHIFYVTSLLILFLVFSSKEGVLVFNMRIWYLVVFVVFMARLWWLLRYGQVKLDKMDQIKKEQEEFNKYMPTRKK